MKKILILPLICLIFGNALTAPVSEESKAVITNYENNKEENGNYNFSFKTSNGIERSEQGYVINTGSPEYMTVRGGYSYIDPDGKLVIVRYYADDTGFHLILPQTAQYAPPPAMPISGTVTPSLLASLLGAR